MNQLRVRNQKNYREMLEKCEFELLKNSRDGSLYYARIFVGVFPFPVRTEMTFLPLYSPVIGEAK